MAIFHLSVKVISRANGRSAVAASAYRAGERLHDERLDRDHDFTNKDGVGHSEVMLPEGAPPEFADREKLWNAVETAEKRKDAQLSREVEFAIPREMNKSQGIALARDFVKAEFVEKGMIADLNVHWDIGKDGQPKPHAHVMLTMREVGKDGFGAKVRDWNKSELVEQWRERWADHVNQRLAELDIDARVDHRSLEAQGIGLEPQDKIGPAASRIGGRGLEAERIEEHRAIAQRNGERIIAIPNVALDAITHSQATFTNRDLATFVHRHSHGAYVALSRHRDGVDLHYGREDFADQSKLVRALSRERGKDMASDYSPEQRFAERRGITFRQRVIEIARQLPERAKSIFANFRPQAQKLETLPADQHGVSNQRRAVERFARAADDMAKMREQRLPVLPHQRDALDKAGKALDAIRPHAAADLASAFQRQPELTREAADGRSQGAIRAMQLESEIRVNPVQRADRFVNDWQRLGQARAVMQQDGNDNGARHIAGRMDDMAKGLERDPQVESLLRNRTRELGLGKDIGRDLSRDLAASVSFERTRSIGMSL